MERHQTDAQKVSNIRLANLDFTGKAKKKEGVGGKEFVEIPWVWIQSEPYVAPD